MSLRAAPTQHASLIKSLEGSNPDAAIEDAFNQLGQGADVPLLLALVEALQRRGMAGVAVRLLESTGHVAGQFPEVANVLDAIRDEPDGRVPWAQYEDRFERNLNALSVVGDALLVQQIRDAASDITNTYTLYETPAGNHAVLNTTQAAGLAILFPFQDEKRLADNLTLPDAVQQHGCLLIGAPRGALIRRLLDVTGSHGFKPPIDMVETDVQALGCWLQLVDVSEALQSLRLQVTAGADAPQQYVARASTNLSRTPPALLLTNHRPGWQPPSIDQAVIAQVNSARERHRAELSRRHGVQQHALSPADRAQRFRAWLDGEASDLRVMCVTSRYSTVMQYAARDLVQAFSRQGVVADLVMEPHDSSADVDTWNPLADRHYDLVVVINHLRREYPGRFDPQLPYVCWVQDHMPLIWSREGAAGLTASDMVISQNPWWLHLLFGYPMDRMLATTNLTDRALCEQPVFSRDELSVYTCDVSYVSHGSSTPRQLVSEIAASNVELHACLEQFLTACEREVSDSGFMTERSFYTALLDAATTHLTETLEPQVFSAHLLMPARRILDRVYRHEALEWAAKWAALRNRQLRLYGRGWERHPTLSKYAAGIIEHGRDLHRLAQASTITLQINGFGSMHQRLLDAVMAGGFVLTRYNPVDFISLPYRALNRYLHEQPVKSLTELHERAATDSTLHTLLEAIEALGMPCNDPVSTERGRETRRWVVQSGMLPSSFVRDEIWLDMLRDGHLAPHRAACDLPGFSDLTFRTPQQLHAMLDQYCDSPDTRQSHVQAMRASILEHDTFDVLARRMIQLAGRTVQNQVES